MPPPNARTFVRAAPLVLLAVAVAFRVWTVGQARFTTDEAYFWSMARNIAQLDATPVYGPPLTGSAAFHPGPFFYYLMAIPQFFGSSPWLGGIFVALLHGVAGYLLFAILRDLRGERAGLIGLALFCFAPWDSLYADRIWLSCVAPVWGTAMIYFAWRAARGAEYSASQGAMVFFALVCPQLHMSAPVAWVVCGVLLYLSRPIAWNRRALAIGFILGLAAYAPTIYWEATHNFDNTVAIWQKGFGDAPLAQLYRAPLAVLASAILFASSELGYHFARGYWVDFNPAEYYSPARYFAAHGFWAVANIFSVALSVLAWIFALRSREGARRLTLALACGVLAGAVLIAVARKTYFPHYLNLLMPLVLIPLAMFLERTKLAVLVVIAMASSSVRFHREVDRLDGLQATIAMVERVAKEREPFSLKFEGFDNRYAWERLARTKYRRQLPLNDTARVRYEVKNAIPFEGELPPGYERFGLVVLVRSEKGSEP